MKYCDSNVSTRNPKLTESISVAILDFKIDDAESTFNLNAKSCSIYCFH